MRLKFLLKIALAGSIFLFSSNILLACSCSGEAYFCHELNDTTDAFLQPNFVIKAIKLQDTLHGMFVKVEKNYVNSIEAENILVWGDPGHLCRVYTSNFEIGDTIILGIKEIDGPTGMLQESIGDYWLPACGITYLKIENGVVRGSISTGIDEMPLEDFEFYVENDVYKTECISASTKHQNELQNSIKLYPNPARNLAFVSCENCTSLEVLSIYDARGKAQNIRMEKETDQIKLYLNHLQTGIYFVHLKVHDELIFRKFIVF